MESGVTSIRAILGENTPVTEQDIKEALWNYYFDVEQSVTFLLGGSVSIWSRGPRILALSY